jgi:hypothetical protein
VRPLGSREVQLEELVNAHVPVREGTAGNYNRGATFH